MARLARAGALFLVLTVAITWPLTQRLRVVEAGDSAFFTWAIGWELHALATDPARLPHGNIFHPLRYTLGSSKPAPAVYKWLAAQPGEPLVVELPMQNILGTIRRPAFHESIYMVHSTRHWKPLLNGYAGIEPASYLELREQARRFPSGDSLDALRSRGARYVIVHRGGFGLNKWERIERELPAWVDGPSPRLRPVIQLDGDLVFELID